MEEAVEVLLWKASETWGKDDPPVDANNGQFKNKAPDVVAGSTPDPTWKRCPVCGERLPPDAFGTNKARKDGLQSVCRDCRNTKGKQKRAEKRGESFDFDRKRRDTQWSRANSEDRWAFYRDPDDPEGFDGDPFSDYSEWDNLPGEPEEARPVTHGDVPILIEGEEQNQKSVNSEDDAFSRFYRENGWLYRFIGSAAAMKTRDRELRADLRSLAWIDVWKAGTELSDDEYRTIVKRSIDREYKRVYRRRQRDLDAISHVIH